jgi:hypothetical protein
MPLFDTFLKKGELRNLQVINSKALISGAFGEGWLFVLMGQPTKLKS